MTVNGAVISVILSGFMFFVRFLQFNNILCSFKISVARFTERLITYLSPKTYLTTHLHPKTCLILKICIKLCHKSILIVN